MPDHTDRYEPPEGNNRAALNVRATGSIDDMVNGILIEIVIDEVEAVRGREVGYDLVPVATINWNKPEDLPFIAYILRCPDEPYGGRHFTSESIAPHKHYYQICRSGAREFGKDFLSLWLSTTYLADGKTPVSDWEVNEFAGKLGDD
jgi:hypothetical protein